MGAACALLMSAASCSLSDSEENASQPLIIEPENLPMFQFSEEGVPYRWEQPALPVDIRADVQTELIGYGWRWMQTNEIDTTGYVMNQDYYSNLDGAGPSDYYFTSDTTLTRYFVSDAIPADCYYDVSIQLDAATGVVAYRQLQQSVILRIWSVYQLGGRWYLDIIEPLYSDATRTHWGTSQYVRMTDDELRKVQEQYSTNFEGIH